MISRVLGWYPRFVAVLLLLTLCGNALADEVIRYVHTDALGSPVAYSDANGVVLERVAYEPYGATLDDGDSGPVGYSGHVSDSLTGLTYMQQRYYDPSLAVFLSVDPVSVDMESGALFNRYMYAADNPYTFTDPDGRCTGSRITNGDGTCKSTGGNTTASGPTSAMPEIPQAGPSGSTVAANSGNAADSSWREVKSRLGLSGDLTKNGNILDFGALFHDFAIPAMYSRGGGGLAAVGPLALAIRAEFNFAVRGEHVFRTAAGHVNPATLSSQFRFVQLFQRVSARPANIRPDAVAARLMTRDAAAAGVSTYTQTMRNGSQVWVHVRNGEIVNAGVNAAGKVR